MNASSPRKSGARFWHRKHLLWIIPLCIVAIAGAAVLALPKLVSSGTHRATIEALASSLTGRNVHIRGKLFLTLLPRPQFIAGDITITSPDNETITARSLTLDIAPIPLLRGQISARSITLQSPRIALPWPLPGGAAAIAPPRWLTALHAQISDGVVSLGAITFSHVYADIFTGGDGAFSISGSGGLPGGGQAGYPVSLSLGIGALSAVGSAPVTLDLQSNDATQLRAHISGTYDSSSTLSGTATFGAASLSPVGFGFSGPLSGSADITADPDLVALSDLRLQQAGASLAGSATLALHRPLLTLLLTGQNLVLPLHWRMLSAGLPAFGVLPTHLTLDAGNSSLPEPGGFVGIPHLHATIDFATTGADITSFDVTLPGDTAVWLAGTLDRAGNLLAKAVFSSSDLPSFFAAYKLAPTLPPGWDQANLAANLRGTAGRLAFDGLAGNFGPARVAATVILDQQRKLTGALHFDQLDLTPFIAMLRSAPDAVAGDSALTGDFEVTADRAGLNGIPLEHLLIDAALGKNLVVRRLTANVWGGIAAASFTLSPSPASGVAASGAPTDPQSGFISSARAILALPSGQPAASLLPAGLQPPPTLTRAPLALTLLAAGPADALAASASLTLGAVSITASPRIDLIHQTAAGAFTLRHPDAIAAFKAFGLDAGLAWPGAGSIALRANMLLSPAELGFPDFVLSMGDLTANGALIYSADHRLSGEIDADTLALPPFSSNFTLPWADLAVLQGKIGISADRVLWRGMQISGAASANLAFAQNRLDLAIPQANIANGVLRGDLSVSGGAAAAGAKTTPVEIAAKFSVTGADAALLTLPLGFPITLPGGSLDAAIDLTASGYAPAAWLATLGGNASLAAHSGTLSGFDLPAIVSALTAKTRRRILLRQSLLRNACISGTTPFSDLRFNGTFDSGIYTIAAARLQSAAGSATASGSIDLPDTGLTLSTILLPNVPAPPKLHLTIAGIWPAPRKLTQLKQALTWKPPVPK